MMIAKSAHQVTAAGHVSLASRGEPVAIEQRQFVKGLLQACPMNLLFGEFNQFVQVALVAALQQRIQQHRAKRWRER